MLIDKLWHISTFRLSALFGAMFAIGMVLLLGLIYYQTAGYLTLRVDRALNREATLLEAVGPEAILRRVLQESARDPLNSFGLFSASGEKVAGELSRIPVSLSLDGVPRDVTAEASGGPRRAIARRVRWGEILVVERDTNQLVELRRIILNALLGSGTAIAALAMASAFALSIRPLARIRAIQAATEAIAAGDLAARLPVTRERDELDQLAGLVNAMVDEVERLLVQARTVGESVAHELRTPLTRLRAQLEHACQDRVESAPRRDLLEACLLDVDVVLARFRALLRIAAVESRDPRSFVHAVSLTSIVDQIGELYLPLAAERGVRLAVVRDPAVTVQADGELLFEALSNLTDNAVKFAPVGGRVELRLSSTPRGPIIDVVDNGPGIPEVERSLVTKRFYRGRWGSKATGHGLGLSLVAAVVDLHRYELSFLDAAPGAVVRIQCWNRFAI